MNKGKPDFVDEMDDKAEESQFARLEQKLEEEKWEEDVYKTLRNVLQGEGLDYDLQRNLENFLDEAELAEIITNVLANNDPNYYQRLGFDVPPSVEEFFHGITLEFGAPFRKTMANYYGPDNWRKLVSEALVGEQYGARLRTRALKWNGENVVVAGGLPEMIQVAVHIVRNINDRFSNYGKQDAQNILLRLEGLKDEIEKLEQSIPVNMKDSEE